MTTQSAILYERLFASFSFVLGTMIGSFLNVVIYRLPLGLSVNEPKRSFCPTCKAPIAWYHNLPVIGWLWLRGRCASCHGKISVRYPAIEALTGILFLAVWLRGDWLLALPLWIFVSLLVAATFIDFDHFIIPDEITWGGTVAGLLAGFAFPALMGETSHAFGLLWSLVGAAAGYGLLWGVVEAGKLAFGKKRVVLPAVEPFTWKRQAAETASAPPEPPEPPDAELTIGGEPPDRWSELFNREKDQLVMDCETLSLAGREHQNVSLRCFYNRLELAGTTYSLDALSEFSGRVREFVFPREAMGFGDVKFLACIGAFLGWQAVLFTVAAGSMLGSVVGLAALALGPKAGRSFKLPFGPYLAAGALVWLFAGPDLVAWYLRFVRG